MNNIEFRLDILKKLYDNLTNYGPNYYLNFQDDYLDIPEQIFSLNIMYLVDKNLIAYNGKYTKKSASLSITADGIDIVELYILGVSFDNPVKESRLKEMLSKALSFTGETAKSTVPMLLNLYINSLLGQ